MQQNTTDAFRKSRLLLKKCGHFLKKWGRSFKKNRYRRHVVMMNGVQTCMVTSVMVSHCVSHDVHG